MTQLPALLAPLVRPVTPMQWTANELQKIAKELPTQTDRFPLFQRSLHFAA